MLPYNKKRLDREFEIIKDVIRSGRRIQEFLWGGFNKKWGLDEWKRMFRKRVAKIEALDPSRPHYQVELKKRLLQTASIAIALIAIIDVEGVPEEESKIPSHLPEFTEKVEIHEDICPNCKEEIKNCICKCEKCMDSIERGLKDAKNGKVKKLDLDEI